MPCSAPTSVRAWWPWSSPGASEPFGVHRRLSDEGCPQARESSFRAGHRLPSVAACPGSHRKRRRQRRGDASSCSVASSSRPVFPASTTQAPGWPSDPGDDDLPAPEPIPRAGRHARAGGVRRVAGWFGDQVPETLRGRVGLARGPAVLVALLVVAALAVTVWTVLRSSGSSVAAPARPRSFAAAGPAGVARCGFLARQRRAPDELPRPLGRLLGRRQVRPAR